MNLDALAAMTDDLADKSMALAEQLSDMDIRTVSDPAFVRARLVDISINLAQLSSATSVLVAILSDARAAGRI